MLRIIQAKRHGLQEGEIDIPHPTHCIYPRTKRKQVQEEQSVLEKPQENLNDRIYKNVSDSMSVPHYLDMAFNRLDLKSPTVIIGGRDYIMTHDAFRAINDSKLVKTCWGKNYSEQLDCRQELFRYNRTITEIPYSGKNCGVFVKTEGSVYLLEVKITLVGDESEIEKITFPVRDVLKKYFSGESPSKGGIFWQTEFN